MSAALHDPEIRSRRKAAQRLAVRDYGRQVSAERLRAAPALLLPAVGNTLGFYVTPLAVAQVLDRFATGGDPALGDLAGPLTLFVVAFLGGEVLWRIGIHFLIEVEVRGVDRLYNRAMAELLAKDVGFFADHFAGSLTKRVSGYARAWEFLGDTLAFQLLGNLLPLIFASVILWRYDPLLVVVLVGMMLVTLAAVLPLIRRRQVLVDERERLSVVLSGHVSDSLTNMEAVRAFAREDHEAHLHHRNARDYTRAAGRSWHYQNRRIDLVTAPLYVLTNLAGLLLAISLSDAARGVETVFVTFSYYALATKIVWEFNTIYRNLESHLAEGAQFTELLLEPAVVRDPPAPVPFEPADAGVRFDGVWFRYDGAGGDHLFEDLDLHVASGEKVGLVGRSGGGKTTVTRLLLRFMDVDDGRILVGGQDIAAVRQGDVRRFVGYVPQEPLLFHRSLRDNIRFGRLDATDVEVAEAARLAHAEEFIDTLPAGFDTLVGERGVKLSGGQRQRIAIARAILRAAPVLVLDEATSALDSVSEGLIQDALWRLMEGRTAIVIAHRLSTVQRMDRLIVLEEGRPVEQGTHRELLALGGAYAELWAHQSGGFLDPGELVAGPLEG